MIEQVQQQIKKLIPAIRNLRYRNRLRKLKLKILKDRRLRSDLIQIFKIMIIEISIEHRMRSGRSAVIVCLKTHLV
jgi:hypothetical protein